MIRMGSIEPDPKRTRDLLSWSNGKAAGTTQPDPDSEVLGPCGCTDYHMSDCPTRDTITWTDDPGDLQDRWYGDDY